MGDFSQHAANANISTVTHPKYSVPLSDVYDSDDMHERMHERKTSHADRYPSFIESGYLPTDHFSRDTDASSSIPTKCVLSLSVIKDHRPKPLDLFHPKDSQDPALVPDNRGNRGSRRSLDEDDADADSVASLHGRESGYTLTPSVSYESFEVIEDPVSDQEREGDHRQHLLSLASSGALTRRSADEKVDFARRVKSLGEIYPGLRNNDNVDLLGYSDFVAEASEESLNPRVDDGGSRSPIVGNHTLPLEASSMWSETDLHLGPLASESQMDSAWLQSTGAGEITEILSVLDDLRNSVQNLSEHTFFPMFHNVTRSRGFPVFPLPVFPENTAEQRTPSSLSESRDESTSEGSISHTLENGEVSSFAVESPSETTLPFVVRESSVPTEAIPDDSTSFTAPAMRDDCIVFTRGSLFSTKPNSSVVSSDSEYSLKNSARSTRKASSPQYSPARRKPTGRSAQNSPRSPQKDTYPSFIAPETNPRDLSGTATSSDAQSAYQRPLRKRLSITRKIHDVQKRLQSRSSEREFLDTAPSTDHVAELNEVYLDAYQNFMNELAAKHSSTAELGETSPKDRLKRETTSVNDTQTKKKKVAEMIRKWEHQSVGSHASQSDLSIAEVEHDDDDSSAPSSPRQEANEKAGSSRRSSVSSQDEPSSVSGPSPRSGDEDMPDHRVGSVQSSRSMDISDEKINEISATDMSDIENLDLREQFVQAPSYSEMYESQLQQAREHRRSLDEMDVPKNNYRPETYGENPNPSFSRYHDGENLDSGRQFPGYLDSTVGPDRFSSASRHQSQDRFFPDGNFAFARRERFGERSRNYYPLPDIVPQRSDWVSPRARAYSRRPRDFQEEDSERYFPSQRGPRPNAYRSEYADLPHFVPWSNSNSRRPISADFHTSNKMIDPLLCQLLKPDSEYYDHPASSMAEQSPRYPASEHFGIENRESSVSSSEEDMAKSSADTIEDFLQNAQSEISTFSLRDRADLEAEQPEDVFVRPSSPGNSDRNDFIPERSNAEQNVSDSEKPTSSPEPVEAGKPTRDPICVKRIQQDFMSSGTVTQGLTEEARSDINDDYQDTSEKALSETLPETTLLTEILCELDQESGKKLLHEYSDRTVGERSPTDEETRDSDNAEFDESDGGEWEEGDEAIPEADKSSATSERSASPDADASDDPERVSPRGEAQVRENAESINESDGGFSKTSVEGNDIPFQDGTRSEIVSTLSSEEDKLQHPDNNLQQKNAVTGTNENDSTQRELQKTNEVPTEHEQMFQTPCAERFFPSSTDQARKTNDLQADFGNFRIFSAAAPLGYSGPYLERYSKPSETNAVPPEKPREEFGRKDGKADMCSKEDPSDASNSPAEDIRTVSPDMRSASERTFRETEEVQPGTSSHAYLPEPVLSPHRLSDRWKEELSRHSSFVLNDQQFEATSSESPHEKTSLVRRRDSQQQLTLQEKGHPEEEDQGPKLSLRNESSTELPPEAFTDIAEKVLRLSSYVEQQAKQEGERAARDDQQEQPFQLQNQARSPTSPGFSCGAAENTAEQSESTGSHDEETFGTPLMNNASSIESAETFQRDLTNLPDSNARKGSSLFDLVSDSSSEASEGDAPDSAEYFSAMEPYYIVEEPPEPPEDLEPYVEMDIAYSPSVESAEEIHRENMYGEGVTRRSNWRLADHLNLEEVREVPSSASHQEVPPDVLQSALNRIFAQEGVSSLQRMGHVDQVETIDKSTSPLSRRTSSSEQPPVGADQTRVQARASVFEFPDGHSEPTVHDATRPTVTQRRKSLKPSGDRSWYELDDLPSRTASASESTNSSVSASPAADPGLSRGQRLPQDAAKESARPIPAPRRLAPAADAYKGPLSPATSRSVESSGFEGPPEDRAATTAKEALYQRIHAGQSAHGDGVIPEPKTSRTGEPTPEYLERFDELVGLRKERRYDQTVAEAYVDVMDVRKEEGDGPPMVLLYPCLLPDHSEPRYEYIMENLLSFILGKIDEVDQVPYRIVFFNAAVPHGCEPPVIWLQDMYKAMDNVMKDNLLQILIVHPSFRLKAQLNTAGRAVLSKDFYRKIEYVKGLKELGRIQSIQYAAIPKLVRDYDRRREWKLGKNTCC